MYVVPSYGLAGAYNAEPMRQSKAANDFQTLHMNGMTKKGRFMLGTQSGDWSPMFLGTLHASVTTRIVLLPLSAHSTNTLYTVYNIQSTLHYSTTYVSDINSLEV